MRLSVLFAYAACAVIWGTTFFAIRVCIGAGGYPTYLAAALRFTIAAALLGLVVAAGWGRPGPRGARAWSWVVFAGVLNAGGYGLVYTAEESIPGALGAVVYGTAPLLTGVMAALSGTERVTRPAIIGALISLCGIAVISGERLQVSSAQAAGVAMVLASVVLSSTYNVVLKRHAGRQHPLATNAVFLATTAVALCLYAAFFERQAPPWPPPFKPTMALLYLAVVGSIVAFGSYFYLLKNVRLMASSTLALVTPILAIAVDAIWESQKIAPLTYLGAAITLVGVSLNLFFGAPSALAAPTSDARPPTG
ncbi:MAG TPA: EamA family transporter [Polyangia bacterium]|nr:EamA family transporter [Polyangia bacterium]